MRKLILFMLSLAGATLAMASTANAKYSLCNKTSYALSAAIGYVDGDRLATRGWWRLRPGQCKVVLTEPTDAGRYFVYAEAIPGHRGPGRTWSGDTPLCVENSGFFNLRNQEVCRDDTSRQRAFFDVEVSTAANGNWQTDFAEASNFTVYSAEVAGVQRLLGDVGKKIGRIDGSLGRETQRALSSYRREKELGGGSSIDNATIDALIEDANTREAKRGFFYCNKTEQPIWSAIAEPQGEDLYESRGWWRIEAGECSKIVKGTLSADHYYVYAATEETRGERRLSGGDRAFCVNSVRFSLTNELTCEDQELEEAVFRRIDIGGADSATFEFTADKFVAPPTETAPEPAE